MGRDARYES